MGGLNTSDDINDSDFHSIHSLMHAAREGDDEARSELFEQLQSWLGLIAGIQTGERNRKFGASDIVQQTCILAVQHFDEFEGSNVVQFKAWLRAILNNAIRQAKRDLVREKRDVRKERKLQEGGDSRMSGYAAVDELLTPATTAIRREQLDALYCALDQLPEDYREVIQLRSFERLSFPEVAEKMNRSVHSVTKLWYRGFTQLQKLMESADAGH